jgi:hypothetical protein
MDALVWVDHQHPDILTLSRASKLVVIFLLFDVVKTIYWANLNTRTILGAQTICGNNVSHLCRPELKIVYGRYVTQLIEADKGRLEERGGKK